MSAGQGDIIGVKEVPNLVQLLEQSYNERLTAGIVYKSRSAGTIRVTAGAATVASAGEIVTPAYANIAPATDYFTIINPDMDTYGFWFAGGRIQCIAKASMTTGDYIVFDLGASTHAFWFDLTGSDVEPSHGADASTQVDISGATTASNVGTILEAAIDGAAIGINATNNTGLVALAVTAPGSGLTLTETVTDAGFTVELFDTIPAAVAALDNQEYVRIHDASSADDMGGKIESAVNSAFPTLLVAANTTGTVAITIAIPLGADGDDWDITENVADVGFTVTSPTGGVGPDTFDPQVDGVSIVATPTNWVTSNNATATAIAAAINSYTSTSGYYATVSADTVTVRRSSHLAPGVLTCATTQTAAATVVDFSTGSDWTHLPSGSSLAAGHYDFTYDEEQCVGLFEKGGKFLDWRFNQDQAVEYMKGQLGATGETLAARTGAESPHIIPSRGAKLVRNRPDLTKLIGTLVLSATTTFDYSAWTK